MAAGGTGAEDHSVPSSLNRSSFSPRLHSASTTALALWYLATLESRALSSSVGRGVAPPFVMVRAHFAVCCAFLPALWLSCFIIITSYTANAPAHLAGQKG